MKKIYLCCLLALFLISFQCASTMRIGEIRNAPDQFHNKKVTISGTVDETITLPILGVGVYQLNDGTGKIWIKPKERIPEKGKHVVVTGTLKVGI